MYKHQVANGGSFNISMREDDFYEYMITGALDFGGASGWESNLHQLHGGAVFSLSMSLLLNQVCLVP